MKFQYILFNLVIASSLYAISVPQPDDFSLTKVKWLHTNISGWPGASYLNLSTVEVKKNGQICLPHSQARYLAWRRCL